MDPIAQLKAKTGIDDDALLQEVMRHAGGDMNVALQIIQTAADMAAKKESAPKPKPKPFSGGITTMNDLKRLDTGDDDSDSDEDTNKYWVGGGKDSGVQVTDPTKKPNITKLVQSVFEQARKKGAKTDEEVQEENEKSFGGSGYRLGSSSQEHSKPAVVPKQAPQRKKIVVTFFRQGFVVDDGPLRRYNDPLNHQFLRDVDDGYVPHELEASANGSEVETTLVDKKNEDYKEPEAPKYVSFSGSGHSLGSSSSSSSQTAPPPQASSSFIFNPDAPAVSIQVRFHDGTKATAKVNKTHTIADLRAWINMTKPTSGVYDLLIAHPPKPLNDPNQTVEQAGLAGAAVIQKLR